jgi:peptidyl-prolyl cis-trans isomerase C
MKSGRIAALAALALSLLPISPDPVLAQTAAAPRTAAARRPAASKDTVLARIGRETITTRDVQRRIDEMPEPYRTNYSTPDGRRQFIERLLEERVWLLGAKRRGVHQRPEVRSQLEASERDLVIRTFVNEVMAGNPAPSDSAARAWYESHQADYRQPGTVTMSHIQVKTEAEGKRLRQWLRTGQDWKKLAARYSTDSLTRATGGLLGTVTREGIFGSLGTQPALAESAFALGSKAIGGPFRTARGWHVLQVDTVRAETIRPFEQVRSLILRNLGQTRSQEFYRAKLAEEKAALGFTVDSSAIRAFAARKETPQELFRRGQEAGAPAARIAAYRRVVDEHPDADVSPQALFMIGFVHSEELKNYDEAEQAFRELLSRYPKSELAESARWMIDHMRTEEAPSFILDSESGARTPGPAGRPAASGAKPATGKP